MLKAKISYAMFHRVELTDIANQKYIGWLIKSPYNCKQYMILPINNVDKPTSFNASIIKSIKHLSNGVVLK